jgi:hypothetical protein
MDTQIGSDPALLDLAEPHSAKRGVASAVARWLPWAGHVVRSPETARAQRISDLGNRTATVASSHFISAQWAGGEDGIVSSSEDLIVSTWYGRDGVEGNGYPHTAQLCKLQSDMNVLQPKEGLLASTPSIRRIRNVLASTQICPRKSDLSFRVTPHRDYDALPVNNGTDKC